MYKSLDIDSFRSGEHHHCPNLFLPKSIFPHYGKVVIYWNIQFQPNLQCRTFAHDFVKLSHLKMNKIYCCEKLFGQKVWPLRKIKAKIEYILKKLKSSHLSMFLHDPQKIIKLMSHCVLQSQKPDIGVYYCNATNPVSGVSVISRNATLRIACEYQPICIYYCKSLWNLVQTFIILALK